MPDLEQQENLDRVEERIGGLVLEFCREAVRRDRSVFFMEDLREFVAGRLGFAIAPDSPGRILRLLRRRHMVDYIVLSRSESLYEVTRI